MKLSVCSFLLFLLIALPAFNEIKAQSTIKNDSIDEDIVVPYEIQPQFPGGEEELIYFINKNLNYPKDAILKKMQGRVIVRFKVTSTGDVTDIKVLRGIGKECDREAIRVIRKMPKWEPGGIVGECYPCDVWFTIPINFRLPD